MTHLPRLAPSIRAGTPLVTVIVPCFGEGKYLDDCLNSVRTQTYPHLEIIVIDDAGTDDSLAVAMEHALADGRVELLRTLDNVGLGAIRNLGIRKAKGDLLLFLDGDDWIPPDAVSKRVEALTDRLRPLDDKAARRVAGVFGDWQHTTFDAGPDHPVRDSHRLVSIDLDNSRGSNVFVVSAPLVRRDLLLLSGGFAEDVRGGEDHLAWMRILAMDTVFVPCQYLVAFYRQKATSMLRHSAETVAVFGVATRGWMDGVLASLPSRDDPPLIPDMRRPRTGELLATWGRQRRKFTRVAAIGPAGDRGMLPETPSSDGRQAPTLNDATEARISHELLVARDFLTREVPEADGPEVTHFRRGPCGLTVTRVNGNIVAPLGRSGETRVADAVVYAHTMVEGFEAAAIAMALVDARVVTELQLATPARRGALSALALAPVICEGLRINSRDESSARVGLWVTSVPQAGHPGPDAGHQSLLVEDLSRYGGRDLATPGAELLGPLTAPPPEAAVLLVPADDVGASVLLSWLERASAITIAAGSPVKVVTLSSRVSRLLADRAMTHRHGGIVELMEASAIICQDSDMADLASLANPATLLLTGQHPLAQGTSAHIARASVADIDHAVAQLREILTYAHHTGPLGLTHTSRVVDRVQNALAGTA